MAEFLKCVGVALLATLATGAAAENYPSRPVTLVVSFAPGGLSDVPARILAAELQERLRQSFVVENRPGGSGITGASYVLHAEPDGYTLLVNALADVQNLHYLPVPYDAINDFALVGMVADGPPLVLIVTPELPFKSVAELIAGAKAKPGTLSFGTSGPATSPAIAVTQLSSLAATKIVEVPYRGTTAAASAVVSGEVQGAFVFYPNAKPLADDGRVRALAVASASRIEAWPDLPTMAELGFAGFNYSGFVGLAAPKGTPPQTIAVLNQSLNEVARSSTYRKRIEALGMVAPPEGNTPETFAEFMRRETAHQADLARLSGHAAQGKP